MFHCAYPLRDLRTQYWSLFDWLPDDQGSDLHLSINQHSVLSSGWIYFKTAVPNGSASNYILNEVLNSVFFVVDFRRPCIVMGPCAM